MRNSTGQCESCKTLKTEISQIKRKVTRLNKKLANSQKKWVETFKYIQAQEHRQLPKEQTGETELIIQWNLNQKKIKKRP